MYCITKEIKKYNMTNNETDRQLNIHSDKQTNRQIVKPTNLIEKTRKNRYTVLLLKERKKQRDRQIN